MPRGRVYAPAPIEAAHPLNRGLAAWWLGLPELSGGPTLYDLTQRNAVAATNAPTWRGAPLGPDGFTANNLVRASDQYFSRASTPSLEFTTGVTLAGWVKHDTVCSAGEEQPYILKASSGSWATPYAVWCLRTENTVNTGNQPRLAGWVNDGSNSLNFAYGNTTLAVGTWYHVAFTYDLTTAVVYLNGVSDGTRTISAALSSSTHSLILSRITGLSGYGVNGQMADWRVYSRGLPAAEVWGLYDHSRRGHPDTLRRVSRAWFALNPQLLTAAYPGCSLGSGTATGAGAIHGDAPGVGVGLGGPVASGASTAASPGVSLGTGIGKVTIGAILADVGGTSVGVGQVTGIGAAAADAAGVASGAASTLAVGAGSAAGAGAGTGTGLMIAAGGATGSAPGTAVGTAVGDGPGAVAIAAPGASGGMAVAGSPAAIVATSPGCATAWASGAALGAATAGGSGTSAGTGSGAAPVTVLVAVAGTAFGMSALAGLGATTWAAAGVGIGRTIAISSSAAIAPTGPPMTWAVPDRGAVWDRPQRVASWESPDRSLRWAVPDRGATHAVPNREAIWGLS